MEITPSATYSNQDVNTGGTQKDIWLDLLPIDVQTRIATHATAGTQSRDFLNLALSSKAQAHAVWNVSRKAVDLQHFIVNDAFLLRGIGNGRIPAALEIARQFEGCDLHIGATHLTPPIMELLQHARINSWHLRSTDKDFISAVLRKGEAEHIRLEVRSRHNLKELLTSLASLPLKTLRLQSGILVSRNIYCALADACHELARLCPSLEKISLTELFCDFASDCSAIERLPDCCEISFYVLPPVGVAEKLESLRSVGIELLCSDAQLQFANRFPSILQGKSTKLTWKIRAEHGIEEGLLTLQKLRPGQLSSLHVCSSEPVFSSGTLPHFLLECRVTELLFTKFCLTSQEWSTVLKQAGPYLRRLKISPLFCPSSSHFGVLTHFQEILISILKYNHNLEVLEFLDRAYCDPWTAPFASSAMVDTTRVLVGRVQMTLPRLNEGKLLDSVDFFLKRPSRLLIGMA